MRLSTVACEQASTSEAPRHSWTGLDQLVAAHSAAKAIDLKRALDGMPVPLHPGAEKYYKEVGLIK